MALGSGGSSSAIRAGRAFVEIFSKDGDLRKGLGGLKNLLNKFGKGIAGIGASIFAPGAAILAGIGETFREMINHFSEIDDGSKRIHVTAEEYQHLQYIASQTSVSMETLEKASLKVQAAIASNSPVLREFIGNIEDFKQLDAPEQLAALAEGFNKLVDKKGKAYALMLAVKLLGKSAKELGPIFAEGKQGILDMKRESIEQLGVFSKEDIKRGEKFGDLLSKISLIIRNAFFTITASLLGTVDEFDEFVTTFAQVVRAIREWVNANRQAVVVAIAVVAAVTAIGFAITVVGAGLIALAAGVSAVVTLWGALTAVVGFFFTPVGLAVIGIVALVAAITLAVIYFDDIKDAVNGASDAVGKFVSNLGVAFRNAKYFEVFDMLGKHVAKFLQFMASPALTSIKGIKIGFEFTGDSLKNFYNNTLTPFFSGIKRDGSTAIQGILDSIIYGDFDGAMEIAGLGLLSVWTQIVVEMEKAWAGFKSYLVDGFLEAVYQIEIALVKVGTAFEAGIARALLPLAKLTGNKQLQSFLEGLTDPKHNDDMLKALEAEHKKDLDRRKKDREQDIASAENDAKTVREKLEQAARVAEILRGSMFTEDKKQAGDDLLKETTRGRSMGLFSAPDTKRAFTIAVDKDAKRTADASEETAENTKNLLDVVKNMNSNESVYV